MKSCGREALQETDFFARPICLTAANLSVTVDFTFGGEGYRLGKFNAFASAERILSRTIPEILRRTNPAPRMRMVGTSMLGFHLESTH